MAGLGMGRNVAGPLLILNLIFYCFVLGFVSWCLNRFIDGKTNHPSKAFRLFSLKCFGGNGATPFFLTFAMLAAVLGIVSKFAGGNHVRFWRNDSLAAAGATSLVTWAVTVLAFGLACKEIALGGYRGWRLKIVEAFIIIATFTELLNVLFLHAGVFDNCYGPGYRDPDYGMGAPVTTDKPTTGVTGTRVV